jgi:hypothetical protein
MTLPPSFIQFEFAPAVFEVLPDFGPAGAGIFGVMAQLSGGADEPFISEIGTLLPIALCGRNSL